VDSSLSHRSIVDFEQLVRVVPVGQARASAPLTVTLTSLELYREGFVAVLALELAPGAGDAMAGIPVIIATDDRGKRYSSWPLSGHGGGSPHGVHFWRSACVFTPALNSATTALSLNIALVTSLRQDRDGTALFEPRDVMAGPWTLAFDLPERSETQAG
jgi:hypothetical protein